MNNNMFRNGKKPEYKSPITIDRIGKEFIYSEENKVITEIRWKLGVDVDKEELLKALAYDRNQYEKGFNDAKAIYGKAIDKACEKLAFASNEHIIEELGSFTLGEINRTKEQWKEWLMKDE